MTDLIEGLLQLARLGRQQLKTSPIDMKSLAESVFEEAEGAAPGRTIECRISDMPLVSGDPTLMRQVLMNLISNAVKFTATRDSAMIEVGSRQTERETV